MSNMTLFIIWACVAATIIFGGIFYSGFLKTASWRQQEEIQVLSILIGLGWPIVAAFMILGAPFWLAFNAGKMFRSWIK